MTRTPRASHLVALALAATFALPTLAVTAGCGSKSNDQMAGPSAPSGPMNTNAPMNTSPMQAPAKPGLSGKQKVVLLAGAALLFYLYKRDLSQNAKAAAAQNGTMANGRPQLYREEKGPNKGAIYYRRNDANHTVVWLSAPQQPVAVPADQVSQYLPDYNGNPSAYQGQVNTSPQPGVNGGIVQSADRYAGAGYGGPPGPHM